MESRTKYHLVIFQQGGLPFEQDRIDTIGRSLVSEVQVLLDDRITTPPENTDIDIWLESPGGDVHSAYKLILDLRSRCTNLCVIVPDYAKSAATLIALGADCLYMSAAAELGPLDVQLQHPDKENVQISGLDVTNSLIYLTQTALDLTISGGVSVIKWTQLPRQEVLHELLQFMARFLKPAISKLDPHIIHKATNELKVAEIYALRMLKMRNLPQGEHMSKSVAKKLLDKLVKNYPTHGFVISRDEATELGLPIQHAESKYSRWKYVKEYYTFYCQQDHSIINIFLDSELDVLDEATGTNGDNIEPGAETVENAEIIETEVVENDHEISQEGQVGAAPR